MCVSGHEISAKARKTHPHVVVPACCGQSALAMGLKVSRVYRSVLVVPGHQQRSGLHGVQRYGSPAVRASVRIRVVLWRRLCSRRAFASCLQRVRLGAERCGGGARMFAYRALVGESLQSPDRLGQQRVRVQVCFERDHSSQQSQVSSRPLSRAAWLAPHLSGRRAHKARTVPRPANPKRRAYWFHAVRRIGRDTSIYHRSFAARGRVSRPLHACLLFAAVPRCSFHLVWAHHRAEHFLCQPSDWSTAAIRMSLTLKTPSPIEKAADLDLTATSPI